ncbi:glycosyltransferase [Pseudomonas cichorii]|uniref:glycosyltransferase n=1 Tax=Pseudomonas cichorii TaxID=36746 RepID=UPI000F00DD39|nr:glycosyltransferase [Pseudomonas cichorii]
MPRLLSRLFPAQTGPPLSGYFRRKPLLDIPDWPANVSGFSYSPFRPDQTPLKKTYPTREQIREDLLLIRPFSMNIRTYSVEGTLAYIPEIAEELGMQVALGIWISDDGEKNREEMAIAIELANRLPCVTHLIVGNEVLFRGDVSVGQLIAYIHHVRQRVKVPVAASEIWGQWLETPELANHSDFIAAHILPFWEGLSVREGSSFVLERAKELQQRFPDKPLILSEIGWPSKGNRSRGLGISPQEQSIYLRTQLSHLNQCGYRYFVIEAFDQPWKVDEGIAGPHWGFFDAQRQIKLQLYGPLKRPVNWRSGLRKIIAAMRPESLFTAIALPAGAYCLLVWAGMHYAQSLPWWVALILSLFWAAYVLIGLAVESHEFFEACWGAENTRPFHPLRKGMEHPPKVSVQIACYNEPADMLKKTLDALRGLDYPDFEVLIIDNNTRDKTLWQPIAQYCRLLGSHFRFFHVDVLPGFKAGALNYLLDHMAPDVEIVAVIDADYCVNRHWLKHMVPHFCNPAIAVIQVPQDYRDAHQSLFKRCCQAEYRGFFNIGMVLRNEHDAIIQHGTMTLIRRSALESLRWAQWCICEDAELGLRMLESGFSTGYAPVSYGQGLTPDSFTDFKKQRHRWVYGAIQIIKKHAASLFTGSSTSLSRMQRYHFLAGWTPWLAEGVNYLLTLATLLWSMAMILTPEGFAPLPWIFSTSLLLMFTLRTLKTLSLYGKLVNTDIREALAATLAGIALYPTIGKAVLTGIFTSRLPFFRTPKHTHDNRYRPLLLEAREELCLLLLSWLAILGLLMTREPDIDLGFWIAMLFAHSLPFLAATIMAFLSAHSARAMQ